MSRGFVVTPDGSTWVDLTEDEQATRDEIKRRNEEKQAEKQAAKAAKKAALTLGDNAGLDGLRDVVSLLAGYEVERDGE